MREIDNHKKLAEKLEKNPRILEALPPLYQHAAHLLFPEIKHFKNHQK